MTEYQNNLSMQVMQETMETLATDGGWVHPHSTLATRYYCLPTINIQSSQPVLQGVDQEFNAYSLATPSSEGTHSLVFWEVGLIHATCLPNYCLILHTT